MAYPEGWKYVASIDTTHAQVAATHTNFTIVVREFDLPDELLDADGDKPALSDGSDIRFCLNPDGSGQLARAKVRFSTNNNPALAYAEFNVLLGTLPASVAKRIYVVWGNPAATEPAVGSTYGQYNSMRSSCVGWYPMHEDATDSQHPQDLSSSQNNGTYTSSANSPVTGQVGLAQLLGDAANTRVTIPDDNSLDFTTGMRFTCWINLQDASSINKPIMAKWGASGEYILMIDFSSANKIKAITRHSSTSKSAVTSNNYTSSSGWTKVTMEDNGSNVTIQTNGGNGETITGDAVTENMDTGTETIAFGAYNTGSPYLHLEMDHAKFYNESLGHDWDTTEYNNEKNTDFLTTGAVQDLLDVKRFVSIQ
jgi:hypothetical protein